MITFDTEHCWNKVSKQIERLIGYKLVFFSSHINQGIDNQVDSVNSNPKLSSQLAEGSFRIVDITWRHSSPTHTALTGTSLLPMLKWKRWEVQSLDNHCPQGRATILVSKSTASENQREGS